MPMKIQKNSRQIPKVKNITANKSYDDLMYGYLQSISYKSKDNRRWIDAKNITYSKLAKELKIENTVENWVYIMAGAIVLTLLVLAFLNVRRKKINSKYY